MPPHCRTLSAINPGLISLVVALLLAAGCREQAPPQPARWESVPTTLTASFQAARPELRDLALAAVGSLRSNDVATASLQLQALCGQAGLTDRQREDATRCWLTVQARLRTAAAAGDQNARETIDLQRGGK